MSQIIRFVSNLLINKFTRSILKKIAFQTPGWDVMLINRWANANIILTQKLQSSNIQKKKPNFVTLLKDIWYCSWQFRSYSLDI